MSVIVDAQLPAKLCEVLSAINIRAIHVENLPEGDESTDEDIMAFADQNDLMITKDANFYHFHMALGRPRKLFLLMTGNIKNRRLFDLIRANSTIIEKALKRSYFIELSAEGLIEH